MMERNIILNWLASLEVNYNKAWRVWRRDLGRKDSHHRWLEIKE